MTLRVPGIYLALALLFLMQRERPGLTTRAGLEIFAGSVCACVTSLAWVQITDGTDMGRFLAIILGIFVAAFCLAATPRPPPFSPFPLYRFLHLSHCHP